MQPVTAAKVQGGIWGLIVGAIIATIARDSAAFGALGSLMLPFSVM